MKEIINRCPLCQDVVSQEKSWTDKRNYKQVHGICWELGYSKGGWGVRKDFIPRFSEEICDDCFEQLEKKIQEFKDLIEILKKGNDCTSESIPQSLMTPLSYGIHYNDERKQWITVEATKYSEDGKEVLSWAVRDSKFAMSKEDGSFDYEPMPSSRDDDFYKEYRFATPEDAAECWRSFHLPK